MKRAAWLLPLALAACSSTVDNVPPVARLRTPMTWDARQPVTVDATASTDEDGVITRYTYLFGDGTPEEVRPQASTQHVFTGPGSFQVELTVEDDDGARATVRRTVVLVDALETPYCAVDADCGADAGHCAVDGGLCFEGP